MHSVLQIVAGLQQPTVLLLDGQQAGSAQDQAPGLLAQPANADAAGEASFGAAGGGVLASPSGTSSREKLQSGHQDDNDFDAPDAKKHKQVSQVTAMFLCSFDLVHTCIQILNIYFHAVSLPAAFVAVLCTAVDCILHTPLSNKSLTWYMVLPKHVCLNLRLGVPKV